MVDLRGSETAMGSRESCCLRSLRRTVGPRTRGRGPRYRGPSVPEASTNTVLMCPEGDTPEDPPGRRRGVSPDPRRHLSQGDSPTTCDPHLPAPPVPSDSYQSHYGTYSTGVGTGPTPLGWGGSPAWKEAFSETRSLSLNEGSVGHRRPSSAKGNPFFSGLGERVHP